MAKIARAQIVPPDQLAMFETYTQTLARALVPGASVERYRRIWRLGQTGPQDGFILGRIGFEGERQTFIWHEESKDFAPGPTPNGLVVPFVINLYTFRAVFQIRPPEIRTNSFAGALEGILRGQTSEVWRVEPLTRQVGYEEWRASVDKVTRMHFHVEQPNPNWEGRPRLEDLMHRLGDLDSADFGFAAANGIVTDDELIVELVHHVQRYGHGTMAGPREIEGHVVESVLDTNSGEIEEVGSIEEVASGDAELGLLMGMGELADEQAAEDPEESQADV